VTEVIIRKANVADLKALQEIAKRTIRRSYNAFNKSKSMDSYISKGMTDKEIAKNLKYCDLMEISGKIIGFAISIGSYVNLLMIDYSFHKLGYGKQLLNYIESKLKKLRPTAHLETYEGNDYALNFYKKNNWKIIKSENDNNTGLKRIHLEKRLA
jgi:ribosomal protein S18 acetylase RimI-like enzyme|tara:strand:- start:115 stop:579 length:465 start_codon:yes stop_codon:yes gene_type:complete